MIPAAGHKDQLARLLDHLQTEVRGRENIDPLLHTASQKNLSRDHMGKHGLKHIFQEIMGMAANTSIHFDPTRSVAASGFQLFLKTQIGAVSCPPCPNPQGWATNSEPPSKLCTKILSNYVENVEVSPQ